MVVFVCLFKQKTAYEMRISDWSSDVCSSDLNDIKSLVSPRSKVVGCAEVSAWSIARSLWSMYDSSRSIDERSTSTEHEEPRSKRTACNNGQQRSEERRVGKEGCRTCRTRRSPYP